MYYSIGKQAKILSSVSLVAVAAVCSAGAAHAQNIWTGAVDGDWATAGNWSDNTVPDATTDVVVNGAGQTPNAADPFGAQAQNVTVGNAGGAGLLAVEGSGWLEISEDLSISDPLGENPGNVLVSGASAFLNVQGALTINDSGNGFSWLTIEDSAIVAVDETTTIGDNTAVVFTGVDGGDLIGDGDIVVDGTLLFDQTSGLVPIDKDLSGAGVVRVSSGLGSVHLSGDNSGFSGTYSINAGTLDVTEANGLGGAQGTAVLVLADGTVLLHDTTRISALSGVGGAISLDAASLIVNQDGDTTFAGTIVGNGSLTKSGSGTLTLTGANDFTAGTTVEAGALRLEGGEALSDFADVAVLSDGELVVASSEIIGDLNMHGGTLLVEGPELTLDTLTMSDGRLEGTLIRADSFEFESGEVNAVLWGDGALTKSGDGTLLLTRKNGYSGGTTLEDGVLILEGVIGDIEATGGVLTGTGAVENATIASGATVAPGAGIGTLTVGGDLTFAPGSTFDVEINGAGESDMLDVLGSVTLDGGVVNVTTVSGYLIGEPYQIIHAEGGGSGAFDSITGMEETLFLGADLGYAANDVYLLIYQTEAFEAFAQTPNQAAAAGGAESLGPGHEVWEAIAALDDAESAADAFDALSGEVHASAKSVLMEDNRHVSSAAQNRLSAALGAIDGGNGDMETGDLGGFTFWAQGFGAWSEWDSDGNAAAVERSIGGLTIGADTLLPYDVRLGVLGSISQSTIDIDDRASSGSVETYTLGVYAGGSWDAFNLSGGVSHSWHTLDTSRTVAFPGFADVLSASYSAQAWQAWSEASYTFETEMARFEPFAGLTYMNLPTESFTESGGDAALQAASQSTDATFMTVGLKTETEIGIGDTTAVLNGMIGWQHVFGDTPSSQMEFASGGEPFTVLGVPLPEDSLLKNVGIDMQLSENASLAFQYGGQYGSGLIDHSASLNMTMRF